MTRTEGYYWVREAGGAAQIAEWARTDSGEWRWALTGCSIGIPDQRMTPISGLLSAPECLDRALITIATALGENTDAAT